MALNLEYVVRYLPGWRLFARSVLLVLGVQTVNFFVKFYTIRRKFQRMQKDGLPMPPHHPVLGHLKLVAEIMSQAPSDVHGHVLPHHIELKFPHLGPVFYIDTWPFGPPFLAVASPEAAYQMTQSHSLPKFHALREYMRPMTGGSDLVTMEGSEWKKWKSIFSPGFNSGHLMTLIPEMMKDVSVFCEILKDAALKSQIVSMDHLTTRLSLDIIGRVALNTNLNSQRSTNPFVSALRNQIRWLSFGNEVNLFERYHPLRPMMRWWNDRRMLQYIWRELDLRFRNKSLANEEGDTVGGKSIIDLALGNYLSLNDQNSTVGTMDSTFRDFATSQLRTFVFAGHDSTSSTMCYIFHLLSENPTSRQQLISEHNKVFGLDHSTTAAQISENAHLLNQLPFTLAVIKESLRLYPPASTTRSGEPGYSISFGDRQLPTDGLLVWSNSYAIHRNTNYWHEPYKFLPERWLVPEGDQLYPFKGTFRPFEFGPRNCIGQELAMLEMKVVLAMSVRSFDIRSVYDEWDMLHPHQGVKLLNGDRAYQILSGAAHPSDGLPCRVALSKS